MSEIKTKRQNILATLSMIIIVVWGLFLAIFILTIGIIPVGIFGVMPWEIEWCYAVSGFSMRVFLILSIPAGLCVVFKDRLIS